MRRLCALMAAMILATACRTEGVTLISESELPPDVYGSPQPTQQPTPLDLPRTAIVYLIQDGRLIREEEPLQGGTPRTPEEALWLALLAARPRARQDTQIPEDTRLIDIEVEGTIVTINLSAEFDQADDRQSLALRIAQVVYTLTETPSSARAVRFEIDGVQREVIGGLDLTVIPRPVNRGDFSQFAPRSGSR
jgi:hypothetical protein